MKYDPINQTGRKLHVQYCASKTAAITSAPYNTLTRSINLHTVHLSLICARCMPYGTNKIAATGARYTPFADVSTLFNTFNTALLSCPILALSFLPRSSYPPCRRRITTRSRSHHLELQLHRAFHVSNFPFFSFYYPLFFSLCFLPLRSVSRSCTQSSRSISTCNLVQPLFSVILVL